MLAATYALRPYSLKELNTKDMQVGLAVLLHIVLALAAPGSSAVAVFMLCVHGLTALSLVLAAARGASQYARAGSAALADWFRSALPALPRPPAGSVGASALPGAGDVLRALCVRAGLCSAPPARSQRSNSICSARQQWVQLAHMAMPSAGQALALDGAQLIAASEDLMGIDGDSASACARCNRPRAADDARVVAEASAGGRQGRAPSLSAAAMITSPTALRGASVSAPGMSTRLAAALQATLAVPKASRPEPQFAPTRSRGRSGGV